MPRSRSRFRFVAVIATASVQAACTTAWFSAWQEQRHAADSLRPADPAARPHDAVVNQRVRLRVYADDDYRALSTNWRGEIERQVERASALVGHLGVAFELVAIEPWQRRTGSAIAQDLRDLRALDPGRDVDVVVAMVGALPRFTASLEEIGMADVLGHYMVVRAMENLTEYEGLMRGLTMVSEAEKTEIYYQRRRHKEAVVFVHEWGHSLGALHLAGRECLMHPSYDAAQAMFCPPNADIVQLALSHPDRYAAAGRQRWLEALVAALDGAGAAAGTAVDSERAALVDYARQLLEREAAKQPARVAASSRAAQRGEEPPAPPRTRHEVRPAPPRPAPKRPQRDVQGITFREESETQGCTMLGLHCVDAPEWGAEGSAVRRKVEAELRALAVQMEGDTVGLPYAELDRGQGAFAAIVRCGS